MKFGWNDWKIIVIVLAIVLTMCGCAAVSIPSAVTEKYPTQVKQAIIDNANAGKTNASIKENKEVSVLDDYMTSDITIVEQVASNMGVRIDFASPKEVGAFLVAFNQLSYEDRIKYGVWGEGTTEREQQKILLGR